MKVSLSIELIEAATAYIILPYLLAKTFQGSILERHHYAADVTFRLLTPAFWAQLLSSMDSLEALATLSTLYWS